MFNFPTRSAPVGLTARDFVTAPDGTILIDVREHAEVAASGKARGALHIPLMMLQFRADPRHPDYDPLLDRSARIGVYCASGGRSSSAKTILDRLGYKDVHNIGGFGHWCQAGGAVERA
ncbi:rhodanese-like domain-containing protein [Pseudooceanicola nitratireducens]|uniref:rhodanese-like domain-containing protein n=1 Tax=Pseudooceanicola nitratireducens TaxID=517719 RepID=UPI001C986F6E|nr:rhodanese-like domain-containing protein [Pseudooceanicola nitratireducens]MBY6156919.1 sulfurtransferase [Pseudooceanicola nitratireducens]